MNFPIFKAQLGKRRMDKLSREYRVPSPNVAETSSCKIFFIENSNLRNPIQMKFVVFKAPLGKDGISKLSSVSCPNVAETS